MEFDIRNEMNNGQTSLSEKMLEHANRIADAVFPEPVAQEAEGGFNSEGLQCAVDRIENALMCYVVPFQKKVLEIIMEAFPAKEAQYEQEIRRQEADDALLNATTEWATEKVEKLTRILKDLVL
jgi:hypothetical protein